MEKAKILSITQARTQWRHTMDIVTDGGAVVIERYGKPTAAVISFEDYLNLQEELDELRAARRANAVYKNWKQDPSIGRPWEEVKAELIAEGLFDDENE